MLITRKLTVDNLFYNKFYHHEQNRYKIHRDIVDNLHISSTMHAILDLAILLECIDRRSLNHNQHIMIFLSLLTTCLENRRMKWNRNYFDEWNKFISIQNCSIWNLRGERFDGDSVLIGIGVATAISLARIIYVGFWFARLRRKYLTKTIPIRFVIWSKIFFSFLKNL